MPFTFLRSSTHIFAALGLDGMYLLKDVCSSDGYIKVYATRRKLK
ncbi:MAG: hypothetical protein QW222_06815 [Candidatus Bathyarchaeia archaeon]